VDCCAPAGTNATAAKNDVSAIRNGRMILVGWGYTKLNTVSYTRAHRPAQPPAQDVRRPPSRDPLYAVRCTLHAEKGANAV
jgi:hypothetical protein